MRLSENDKKYLEKMGHTEKDFDQIREAAARTVYSMNGERITARQAVKLLGRKNFLSRLSRSAFHWNCSRETDDGGTVELDSSRLFR